MKNQRERKASVNVLRSRGLPASIMKSIEQERKGSEIYILTEILEFGRARTRAKSGRKFAIGQVFLVFIFAPTGNGLSFFRTATRSGFERCNTNSNPIINPIFYPIFYPIATRLPHIFICFQLIFHILDPLQQKLSLDNTKRVLFCTNTEVDFEILGYLTFWDTFDGCGTAKHTTIPLSTLPRAA